MMDFEAWRAQAREFLRQGRSPEDATWEEAGLFGSVAPPPEPAMDSTLRDTGSRPRPARVSPEFIALARAVSVHRDGGRWRLLYRLLWRLTHENRELLSIDVDDDVHRARAMAKQVSRDIHKMHAFVRFRKIDGDEYVAWHAPDHLIVRQATPFFARRFASMRWTILTPDESASWDGVELCFGPGCPERPVGSDDLETLWRGYYGAIFNPARIKLKTMKREMPVRHWRTLPETEIIADLLAEAPQRVEAMLALQPTSATPFVPPEATLAGLREAARGCRGCGLCGPATQTVFGTGPTGARIVLVGEQPGDEEDRVGLPFVGPAGQVLDRALAEVGMDRGELYLTNAVKHFKFEPQGEHRLHKKPGSREVAACRPWLEAELAQLCPDIIVCLGVTAGQAILGRAIRLGEERGRFQRNGYAPHILVTVHPSAILRTPEGPEREALFASLCADLALVQSKRLAKEASVNFTASSKSASGSPVSGP